MTLIEFGDIQALLDSTLDRTAAVHRGAQLYFVDEMQLTHAARSAGVAPDVLRNTLKLYVAARKLLPSHNRSEPVSEAQRAFLAAIGLGKTDPPA